ncbi:MAG: DUF4012 domain-containing protein [Patescibacteria group bacterium]|nr:DUF4012 domain-containing protein [Patescibacteria group bacterium]
MTEEISKIDFNNNDINNSGVIKENKPEENKVVTKMIKRKKILAGVFLAFVILVLVTIFGVVVPAKAVLSSVNSVKAAAKEAYDAAKAQNIDLTQEKLTATRKALTDTQNKLQALAWTQYVPVAGGYYSDTQHMIKAGFYGLDAAGIVTEELKPYADLLGLKGKGSFVGGSAEERIQTAVGAMEKVTPKLKDIQGKLAAIREEIDHVDPNRYPDSIGSLKIKSNIVTVKRLVDQTDQFFGDARPLLEVLPKLLGQPDEQKYLVLFQNDKELRSTGGFITAYAILRIDKGKINVESSDDIYNLDAKITKKVSAPAPILKYLPLVPVWNLRDTNISPDFYVSMQNFLALYNSIPGKTAVNGIVAIDTQFLVDVMNVLGPIPVYGTEFTTKTVPQCNCSQVIYELELYADERVGYARGQRKDIIGALMGSIMHKALSSSPKIYWGPLFQTGLKDLAEKHVLVYLMDNSAQKAVEALNYGGRIRDYSGDYLHINDTNFAGAKSNMYVAETVAQKIDIAADGTITKTVTLDYKNPQPPSDCNLEHGGLCLNGLLRDWVRIYVPKGSILKDSKGSEVKMSAGEDLGKTVFEGFITVRPQGVAQMVITYQLPFKAEKGKPYQMLIQKQPGTTANQYTISINGKQTDSFGLDTDKELSYTW